MEQIKVCFLMTIYNTPETYLRQAIESILNQTVPEWVLVLRDNGSDDGKTAEILREYAQKDARIFYGRNEVNNQPTKEEYIFWKQQIEQHLQARQVPYFAILDSDDAYAPNFLETTYRVAERAQAEMVICGTTMVQENNEKVLEERIPPTLFLEAQRMSFEQFIQLYGYIRTEWAKLYKSELFDLYEYAALLAIGQGIQNGMDTFRILYLLSKISRLVCIPQSLHLYRIRKNSSYRTRHLWICDDRLKDGELLFLRACFTAKAYGCLTQKTLEFLYRVYEYHVRDLLGMVIQNTAMPPDAKISFFHKAINAPLCVQIGEHSDQMRLMLRQKFQQMAAVGLPISAEQYPQLWERQTT
jgi:glycosyltransferase involved in cell wall biosynthesis